MALNPLDEIRTLGAPEALGGGAPPGMGGPPPEMGGPPPMPGGPPMGAPPPMMPPEMGMPPGADAMADLMGEELVNEDIMAEDAALGEEASTEEAATQVASAIVGMAPSPEEAMNLANAISDKVASMVMEEDMDLGAEGDRLMDLGLGLEAPGMQFGGNVPPPRINSFTMPQQYGQQSWMGGQGQGGGRPMGPPVGGGYRDGGGIGSLMMARGGEPQFQQGPVGQRRQRDYYNYVAPRAAQRQLGRQAAAGGPGRAATSGIGMQRGGEPTMAGGRPIQWQQGPVGQRRKADYMSYVAPGAARRQLGRQAAAGGPGRRAVRGAGGG